MHAATVGGTRYTFPDLKALLAKATPARSGDALAGVIAESGAERVAAQYALADLPLATFLSNVVVPYEDDEITRLIVDSHDAQAFAAAAHLTVGGLRDFLLSDEASTEVLSALAPGLTPEMAAAVANICRLQDLMVIAAKCSVVTRFRNTIGLPERLSVRLQPNHPTDDARGIAVSILDGLLLGAGDAVLAHVTTTSELIRQKAPVDLVFPSIAGTQAASRSFGVDLSMLAEARQAALSLKRGTIGDNVMYFETGLGSARCADQRRGSQLHFEYQTRRDRRRRRVQTRTSCDGDRRGALVRRCFEGHVGTPASCRRLMLLARPPTRRCLAGFRSLGANMDAGGASLPL